MNRQWGITAEIVRHQSDLKPAFLIKGRVVRRRLLHIALPDAQPQGAAPSRGYDAPHQLSRGASPKKLGAVDHRRAFDGGNVVGEHKMIAHLSNVDRAVEVNRSAFSRQE